MDTHKVVHKYGNGKVRIALFQGWGLPPFLWSKTLQFFDLNKFKIMTIDLGKIDLEQNCDLNSFCNKINDILTGDNFYPDFLFGHSMGATIMINLLLNFSIKPKGIVFIDSGLKPSVRNSELMPLINRNTGNVDTYRTILRSFFNNIDFNDLEKITDEFMQYNIEVLKCQLKAISRYDFTGRANLLTLPTLIIFGEYDKNRNFEELKDVHVRIKNSTIVVFQNSAHCPMFEEPARFADIVQLFINRIS